ncbi:MAG: O-antigen ligase family protein [Coriobacteriia bacterium]|nr:O-antigen ligase family protein [Coriobacteriia bacterium]
MVRVSQILLGLICACIVLTALLFPAIPFVGSTGIWALGGWFALGTFALIAPIGLILLAVGIVSPVQLERAGLSLKPIKQHTLLIATLFIFLKITAFATIFAWNSSTALFGGFEAHQGFIAYLGYGLLVLAAIFVINTPHRLTVVSRCLSYTAAIVASFALLEVAGFQVFPLGAEEAQWAFARGVSTMTNPSYLGSYLVIPSLVALGLVLHERGKMRVIAGIAALLTMSSLLFTLSRAAWAGLLIGLILLSALLLFRALSKSRKNKQTQQDVAHCTSSIAPDAMPVQRALGWVAVFWASFLLITGIIAIAPNTEFSTRITSLPANIEAINTGMGGRFIIWQDVAAVIAQNPVLGVGPDNLFYAWQGVSGPDFLTHMGIATDVGTAHNYFLDIAVATGILGIVAFFALIVLTLITVFRTIRIGHDFASVSSTQDETSSKKAAGTNTLYLYCAWAFGLCGMLLTLGASGIRTPLLVCFYLAIGVVVGCGAAEKHASFMSRIFSKIKEQKGGQAERIIWICVRIICVVLGTVLLLHAVLMLVSAAAGNLNSDDAMVRLEQTERALRIAPWRTEPIEEKLQSLEVLASNQASLGDVVGIDWYQHSLDYAHDLHRRFPHNAQYLHLLSVLYMHDPETALAYADQSLQLRPTYLPAKQVKGVSLVSLGHFDEGVALVESAVETNRAIHPNWQSSEYLELLILLHFEQGDIDTAAKLTENLAEEYPNSPLLPVIQGMIEP